jgi:hypothetical protein
MKKLKRRQSAGNTSYNSVLMLLSSSLLSENIKIKLFKKKKKYGMAGSLQFGDYSEESISLSNIQNYSFACFV